MKLYAALMLALTANSPCFAQEKKPPPAQPLAPALRKFDANSDGTLTGDELRLARQAHNRGGREAEPTARKWREMLERSEREFQRRRERDFDLNNNGKTDGPERDEMKKVWRTIADRYTALRTDITAKYDRNDDGELNEQERNASRAESDRRRREEEDRILAAWRAARQPRPGTPSS